MTRKIIAVATITLDIRHYRDDNAMEHIDIDQTLTGGISGTSERRILDWTMRSREDHIFGAVLGKSRRIKIEDIDEPYLKKDWSLDTIEHHAVQAYVESDTPKSKTTWTVTQVKFLANLP